MIYTEIRHISFGIIFCGRIYRYWEFANALLYLSSAFISPRQFQKEK